MATLNEQLQTIFGTLGVQDFASAQVVLQNWPNIQAAAQNADTLTAQQAEYFGAVNATDHASFLAALSEAVGNANTFGGNLSAIWNALSTPESPVTDQATALAAIAKMKGDLLHAQNAASDRDAIFAQLKVTDRAGAMTAIADVDGRINAGVIERAAAAGLPAPVSKPQTSSTGESAPTDGLKGLDKVRAAFEATAAA